MMTTSYLSFEDKQEIREMATDHPKLPVIKRKEAALMGRVIRTLDDLETALAFAAAKQAVPYQVWQDRWKMEEDGELVGKEHTSVVSCVLAWAESKGVI